MEQDAEMNPDTFTLSQFGTASAGIYAIALDDGRMYIGSAVHIRARWSVHVHNLDRNKHHSRRLQNVWNKYGNEEFTFCILENCDVKQLINREQAWMDAEKPQFNIMNKARSALGYRHSEETKKKLSVIASARKRGKQSDETKLKKSLALKGRKPAAHTIAATIAVCTGRKLTPEHKAKISSATKAALANPATRAKISEAGKLRKQSAETRQKIREANLNAWATWRRAK